MSTPDPIRSVPRLALPQQPFTEFRVRFLPGVPVLLGGVALALPPGRPCSPRTPAARPPACWTCSASCSSWRARSVWVG